MKKLFVFAFSIFMAYVSQANAVELNWSGADKIINSIEKTCFPARIYNIMAFGARKDYILYQQKLLTVL